MYCILYTVGLEMDGKARADGVEWRLGIGMDGILFTVRVHG